ncbi:MAG: aminotransferase class I/II-fold pyridoxal phosphate-dependent enzyme [Flavobacteriia bacterium]|nr:aminotransferase class I/II-fold pyridoxal phosphate-dependent enzyme [Flavobacteriia bacterium]
MTIKQFNTQCVHEGQLEDSQFKGGVSPLYMATNYSFGEEKKRYPRYFNTPNLEAVAQKVAALEGAEAGLVFSSGMAAISTAMLSYLSQGDHVVLQNDLYGGSRNFVKTEFPKYGITYTFTEGLEVADFEKAIQTNTKGIYLETPSNPLLKLVDLKAVAQLAQSRGLWSMIDNTFASPVNQNPIAFGIDVVMHSATKYLGGHSDISGGIVVGNRTVIERVFDSAKNLGGNMSEFSAWLLERSIKTLALRVQAQNANAQQIAEWLQDNAAVDQVYYPGLKTHPDHQLATQQMKGFGGMLSFSLQPGKSVERFLENLQLIKPVMSLAGVESTALSPRLTSHALLTEEERLAQEISPQLIRFSTGIEAVSDLLNDLETALIKA